MFHLIFLFFLNVNNISEDVAIENLVGNWERVCLENNALGFQVSHCNYFGDREIYINEWNYIEMIFKNGDRRFYDFKLDGDKMKIFFISKNMNFQLLKIYKILALDFISIYNVFISKI